MNKAFRITLIIVGLLGAVLTVQVYADGDAGRGETLVTACAACHGADGNSAIANFPTLADLGEKYLLKQLQDIKRGARNIPEMAGQLDAKSEQDMADMAAFFDSKTLQLSGSTEQKVQVNSGAKVDGLSLGKKLYRAGNAETKVPACTGCHSPTGQGNAPASYPRLGGQHADYLAKQLRDFRAGNRVNDGDAMIMRGVAKHMSDAEIDAVANFIAGLH